MDGQGRDINVRNSDGLSNPKLLGLKAIPEMFADLKAAIHVFSLKIQKAASNRLK
jgi:hypothetical protein